MIFHPGILALISGSVIVSAMMVYSTLVGLKIVFRWNYESSSSAQLALERNTYLVSTIVKYTLLFEVLSVFLYIYTTDDIHNLFIGAMCATGSLNANPVGWNLLYVKIIIFFLSAIWIAFNSVDQKAEDYPLVRFKYTLLIFIAPLIIYDLYLQIDYFSGLEPNVITACCGALFDEEGAGMASTVAFYPPGPMMIIFYSGLGVFIISALLSFRLKSGFFRYIFALSSAAFFFVSMASVISFVTVYYYEIPTHHCPFEVVQKDYNFIGYPLYGSLFTGVLLGVVSGLLEPLRNIKSLKSIINESQKKWTSLAIICILVFAVLASWPIVFSGFTLEFF